jgi:hypothetical protein
MNNGSIEKWASITRFVIILTITKLYQVVINSNNSDIMSSSESASNAARVKAAEDRLAALEKDASTLSRSNANNNDNTMEVIRTFQQQMLGKDIYLLHQSYLNIAGEI